MADFQRTVWRCLFCGKNEGKTKIDKGVELIVIKKGEPGSGLRDPIDLTNRGQGNWS